MPLARQWEALDRSTVAGAPERWGVYELGDDDGTVLSVEYGVLADELKSALAYGEASRVRYETAQHEAHARELAETHRERLD